MTLVNLSADVQKEGDGGEPAEADEGQECVAVSARGPGAQEAENDRPQEGDPAQPVA